jgi:hypothetical protein
MPFGLSGLPRDRCEPPFERGNGTRKIVAACRERPSKDRILLPGSVEYLGPFLFGSNVTAQYLDDAVQVSDQFTDLQCFPRGGCPLKMALVFHLGAPNDLFRAKI